MNKLVKQEKNIRSLDLNKDGLLVIENFFTSEEINSLEKELDNLFLKPSFNGSSGCVLIKRNRKVVYKCINLPTATIRSVNLLEKACEVRRKISIDAEIPIKNIKLTALEIFEEKNQKPLFWHTDNREGTFRAFVYIKGGELDSGAFRYMLGTHIRDYYIDHKLSKLQINKLQHKIFIASGGPGTLVISNINGFHGNNPRKNTRRLIMFEFQMVKNNYPKSSILLPSYWINENVILNLDMFDNQVDINQFDHSQDKRLKILDPSLDSIIYVNSKLMKPWIIKQVKFLNYQIRKIFIKFSNLF